MVTLSKHQLNTIYLLLLFFRKSRIITFFFYRHLPVTTHLLRDFYIILCAPLVRPTRCRDVSRRPSHVARESSGGSRVKSRKCFRFAKVRVRYDEVSNCLPWGPRPKYCVHRQSVVRVGRLG